MNKGRRPGRRRKVLTPTAERPADSRHEVRIVNLWLVIRTASKCTVGKGACLGKDITNENGERMKGEMRADLWACV